MPNKLAHFAIEAEDVERARNFYETVFGWRFVPWGPPDFYLIEGAGVHGALQKRREPLPDGRKGFECSFAVDDLEATMALIVSSGGNTIGSRFSIPNVCQLSAFCDTEGNEAIVCQYEQERMQEMGLA